MKLQWKVFVLIFLTAILLGGPLLLTVRQAVHRILVEEVSQKGVLVTTQIVDRVSVQFQGAAERSLLPVLQMAQDQTGALYVMASDAAGRVLAHTNVAEKGKIYSDAATKADLRAEKPHSHPALYKGAQIMEITVPVWSQSQPAQGEDFLLGGNKEPSGREYRGFVRMGLPLAHVLETEYRLIRRIVAIILLAGGLGILLFFFFMRRLLLPVQWLSVATARVARGEYGASVPVRTKDELGDLAGDFNRMSRVLAETTVSKEALEESEGRVRLLLDSAAEGIYGEDLEGNCTFANQACARLLGYQDPAELIGKNMHRLLHHTRADGKPYAPEDCPIIRTFRESAETHVDTEVFWRADGKSLPAEYWSYPMFQDGKVTGAVVSFLDITQRRQSEELRAMLFAAVEQSKDSVVITDPSGKIHYVNRSFEITTGYSREEAIGQTPRVLKSGKHDRKFYETMWSTLTSGRVWQSTITNRRKDGTLFEEEGNISPVINESGKITNYVAVKRDITERRKMEEILRQSDKMSAVGQLAAGVAHEINNPLGVILGFAQAVVRRLQANDPLEMPLKSIEKEAIRCKNLVQDLLTFSRASKAEREPLDINRAVEGALSLVTAQARMAHIEVKKELAPDLPRILGNQNQVQQIIINLSNNAMDAMMQGGVLTLKTEQFREGALSWVCLKIIDTGPGIPPEIRPRIFDPFFTTKPVGKGTGLGLSLVHEIVKKHSGTVDVASRPGRTEFLIKFPVRSAGVPSASAKVTP
jgi:PAS domain S-box-containing protein